MATNAHTAAPGGAKPPFPPLQKETYPSQIFWLAIAFVAGAFVILWAERRQRSRPDTVRIDDVDAMRWTDALKVGCAQAFALIPGTSRSGGTIRVKVRFGCPASFRSWRALATSRFRTGNLAL